MAVLGTTCDVDSGDHVVCWRKTEYIYAKYEIQFTKLFFRLSCVHFKGETLLSDFHIHVFVKKKKIKFYLICACRRSLYVTTIVEYELSKLMYFKVQSLYKRV